MGQSLHVHLLVGETQGHCQLPDLMGAEVLLGLEPLVQGLQLLLGEGCAALALLDCPHDIFSAFLRLSSRLWG